ncbi:helix-turn-helix domain-containing protein [Deinococcus rufus]|uniref:Helix-turn-helix domain-containing protein n=1 Tax=Deinococcus rufus TaxID=2136097 RepID=A0ABV7Z8V6_9DEIO
MTDAPRKRPRAVRPAEILTAADRGLALKAWLQHHKIGISDFAINAGISRAGMSRYLSGKTDIAEIQQDTADRLLRAMGVSDEDAWALLGIPTTARSTFRSFRPYPLGHGSMPAATEHGALSVRLDAPLFGSVSLPVGAILRIELHNPRYEHQIYRLRDDRLFAVVSGTPMDASGAVLLGGLAGVDFVAR